MTNKRGWYDGWFYAWIIDQKKSRFRRKIIRSIPAGQRVIDIGCGTGGLCLDLAKEAKYVLGIDISAKQIYVANKRKIRADLKNIEFKQSDAKNLDGLFNTNFDLATIILIIHEVVPDERLLILKEVKKHVNKILILDYSETIPLTFWGVSTYIIEFLAGREHFTNFKDYLKKGGIGDLLKEAGYKIEATRVDRSGVFRYVTAKIE